MLSQVYILTFQRQSKYWKATSDVKADEVVNVKRRASDPPAEQNEGNAFKHNTIRLHQAIDTYGSPIEQIECIFQSPRRRKTFCDVIDESTTDD